MEVKVLQYVKLKDVLKMYGYKNKTKCEEDITKTIQEFTNLIPRVDEFVFNDGKRDEFICLDGTVPVINEGITHDIPICVWLSKKHPEFCPLVQIKSTRNIHMGWVSHIDDAGMLSIPYLDNWSKGTSDLTTLIQVVCRNLETMITAYNTTSRETENDVSSVDTSVIGCADEISSENLETHSRATITEHDQMSITIADHLQEINKLLEASRIMFEAAKEIITRLEKLESNSTTGSCYDDSQTSCSEKVETSHWLTELLKNLKGGVLRFLGFASRKKSN